MALDYPLIWAFILAIGVMMYVLLDGFDLGVGMLTTQARSDEERNMMTSTIEPVWDGNETWLIIGGGGLFAAFPTAYAIVMPAFYLPVLLMLAALIFRGVAFEFRHKAVRPLTKRFWNSAFAGGSFAAAFSQGIMLGGMVQGIAVEDGAYAGGALDWLTPFTLLTGVSVAVGYILLGACWLVLKTEGEMFVRARRWALMALAGVSFCFFAVSLATLSLDSSIGDRWGFSMQHIDFATLLPLLPVPFLGLVLCIWLARDLWMVPGPNSAPDWRPFLLAAGIFLTGYFGIGISLYPYIVPFELTVWDAAAHERALGLMLVGAVIMLPIILIYTAYVYSLFWGKVKPGDGYHA
ncbi:cytochrome d ubiquinol oxidase subunit II [Hyphomonas sp.]|uniref:cytochrome d ubiquinol oxidase subunit II n=1 Tax=Hyphomonas sp. TaxID=87 RepID=UPI003918729E